MPLQYQVSVPLAVPLVLYILTGCLKPEDTPERDALLTRINEGDGDDDGDGTATAAVIPAQGGGPATAPRPHG